MDSTTQKFVDAFGQPKKKDVRYNSGYNANEGSQGYSHRDRSRSFEAAFSQPTDSRIPAPHRNQVWRVNNVKLAKLSFAEKYQIGQLLEDGVPFSELPQGYIDSGVCVPSADEAARDKQLTKETGYNRAERRELVNHARIHSEYLGDLLTNELFIGSQALADEVDRILGRFGMDEVADHLSEEQQTALQVHIDGQKAAKALEDERQRGDTAAEIQEAAQKLGLNLEELKADAQARNADEVG